MTRFHLLAFVFIGLASLTQPFAFAQEEVTENIDRFRPDEHSPFFLDQSLRNYYSSLDGRKKLEAMSVATYPETNTPDSAPQQLKRFFTTMFQSVKFRSKNPVVMSELIVEPASFALSDRREIAITFGVRNTTSKIMELDFPSSQRLEVTVKNSAGEIIERWSDDQFFEQRRSVVMINPDERIQYSEMIPTREMKPGETYIIEATLYNHPEFTKAIAITPL